MSVDIILWIAFLVIPLFLVYSPRPKSKETQEQEANMEYRRQQAIDALGTPIEGVLTTYSVDRNTVAPNSTQRFLIKDGLIQEENSPALPVKELHLQRAIQAWRMKD